MEKTRSRVLRSGIVRNNSREHASTEIEGRNANNNETNMRLFSLLVPLSWNDESISGMEGEKGIGRRERVSEEFKRGGISAYQPC